MLHRMLPWHTRRGVTEESEPVKSEPVKPDPIKSKVVKPNTAVRSFIHRMLPRHTERSVTGSYDTVVRIYVLCHTKERFTSAQQIYKPWPWAIPILMKYQDCTFENAFWKQLLEIKDEWASCDMVGSVSYSAYKKIRMTAIDSIIRDRNKWKSGYVNFNNTQKSITNDHPNLLRIINDVMKTIGMPRPTFSCCNYWMCTPDKMTRFIDWFETMLKPVVLAHPLAMTNAQYPGSLNKQALMTVCGTPFYPHVPFVIERLNKAFFVNYWKSEPASAISGLIQMKDKL